jgi:alpha-beta hydrolase superfamily lysophospholipase
MPCVWSEVASAHATSLEGPETRLNEDYDPRFLPLLKIPRRPWSRRVKARLAFVLLLVAGSVFSCITAFRPPPLAKLDSQTAPIARPLGPAVGCGLNQEKSPDGCRPLAAKAIREEAVRFASRTKGKGREQLQGTLSIPEGLSGPRPAVVLLHGSGPADRDETLVGEVAGQLPKPFKAFAALADLFARNGLVVLRYDKRTCGRCYGPEPAYQWQRFEVDDLLGDARGAVDFLSARPEVDPRRILIAGHSEGAHLAPFVAEGDERVAGLILLAGFCQRWDEELLGQYDRAVALQLSKLDFLDPIFTRLERRKLERCFEKIASGPYVPDEDCIGGHSPQSYVKGYLELSAQLEKTLSRASVPVLVAQGSVDRNSDPLNVERCAAALEGRRAAVYRVPRVGHALTDLLAREDPPRLAPGIAEAIELFLARIQREE